MTDTPNMELVTTLRKGDTFKHANKTHVAEKVSRSAGEVWIEVSFGGTGIHKLVLPETQEVEIVSRAEPEADQE